MMAYFLCVLGMVLVLEGLPYFVFPEKIKDYMKVLMAMPASTLRIVGGGAMAVGLFLIYLGRR